MAVREFKYIVYLFVFILLGSFIFQYKWVLNYYGYGPLVLELSGFDKNKWVIGDVEGLNPEFVKRLEKLGQDIGEKVIVRSGYRTIEEQQKLWDESDKSGKWVAKPGESRHNYGLAADIENQRIKTMTNEELAHYGLFKPMDYEDWHIEPLE
jgi:hypothetical protein